MPLARRELFIKMLFLKSPQSWKLNFLFCTHQPPLRLFPLSRLMRSAFHGLPLSQELVTFAADRQMLIETRCYIIGGTPMGPDQERVQAEALSIARKSNRFFTALQHDAMTAPVADRLLRLCGVPRVQFLARVGLLGEYEDALAFFDAQVQSAARLQAGLADGEDSSAVSIQQAAPLRHAGFAFKAHSGNIALFASVGAFANAARIYIGCVLMDYLQDSQLRSPTL